MSTKKGLLREEISSLLGLIKHLEGKPESHEFHRPLEYKALGLTDYPSIIQKQMDLSTVKKNAKSGQYSSLEEAVSDIKQIWDNTKRYFSKQQNFYKQAEKMEQYMKDYLSENSWNIALPSKREREGQSFSLQDRVDFIEALKQIPDARTASIVDILTNDCPNAISKLPDSRLKLNVEKIDPPTFQKVFK